MPQQRWTLKVNGQTHELDADGQTPLLYILQNELALRGPRFGCGLAQCGSSSVLVDGREARACITPLAAVAAMVSTRHGAAVKLGPGFDLESGTLGDAVDLFEGSAWIKSALGEDLAAIYGEFKRDEWARFCGALTDWETTMYRNWVP